MTSTSPATDPLRVAVLGAGTVGTEVIRLLTKHSADLESRIGASLIVTGIAVANPDKPRDACVDPSLLARDASGLVESADLVVELMGGIEPARTLILSALRSGAAVVTANKALLAAHGPELYEAADDAGVDLFFEAAVAGAIPLVRPIRESLAGDRITRILGIVNGTTNYVLDKMTHEGLDFGVALAKAQELGFAEADPTADVEGHDAAAKAAILASIAFHTRVTKDDVFARGISEVSAEDVATATDLGMIIKLLAIVERVPATDGSPERISARVYPAMIRRDHALASVGGAFNAVFVESEAAGDLMFYGAGAGGAPTASAVLGDLVSAARQRVQGGKGPSESRYADLGLLPMDAVRTRYYLRLDVVDRPGVLARVAEAVSRSGVSIETVRQASSTSGSANEARSVLSIVTHEAVERDAQDAIARLEALDVVIGVRSILRVEAS